MQLILPSLPKPVGMVTHHHETPGVLVEHGGKIISTFHPLIENVSPNEFLYTTTQLKEFALQAIIAERLCYGIEVKDLYVI
jgi:hypothetical protein